VTARLSVDLQREFPGQQGFSPRNLKYMRAFAEAWPETVIVQQPDAQLTKPKESNRVIMHQPGAQLQWLPQPPLLDKLDAPPTGYGHHRSQYTLVVASNLRHFNNP
jgi:hypothetical protein